ncbi:unnamed protein product, partial [Closterium sp. NIES-54]
MHACLSLLHMPCSAMPLHVPHTSASSNLFPEPKSQFFCARLSPRPSSSSKASSNTRSSGSGSSSSSSGSGNSSLLREMSDSFDDAVLGQLGMARTNLPCDLPGGEEIFRLILVLTIFMIRDRVLPVFGINAHSDESVSENNLPFSPPTFSSSPLPPPMPPPLPTPQILVLAIFMIRDRVLSVFGIDAHSDESVSENETLGSAGLALRYARIILLAEKLMKYPFMAAGGTT